jgi:WG containing repeat
MIIKIKKMLLYFLAIQLLFITLSSISHAATCSNNWLRPSFQTMEMENMSASITEYANGERHFSIRQGEEYIDVYYLKGALLVKGPSADKIESYSRETIWWLPMVFVVPASVLSQAVPNGPCKLDGKTPFSIKLSGAIGYGPHKLTHAEGEVFPTSPSEIVYKFTAATDPPTKDGKFIRYSGTLKLSPQEAAPKENANILGYTLVRQTRPFLVVGKSDLPVTTLGELLRALIEMKSSSKKWIGPIPEIVMAPEEKEGTGTKKEIYPFRIGGEIGFYGFVDKKGQVVMETPCLIMEDFHDDMAVCSTIVKAGYINKAGEVIVEPQYGIRGYTNFSEGLAAVKKDGEWGYIDKTGVFAIKPQFEWTDDFKDDVAFVKTKNKLGVIDKSGNFIIKPQSEFSYIDKYISEFSEGVAVVQVAKEKKWRKGYIDKSGRFLINPQFENAGNFQEGLAPAGDKLWGYIDKTGKYVIEPQFEIAADFQDNIALVIKNGKWGYINKKGQFIFEQRFNDAFQFHDGIAAVKKDGKWGCINKSGNFIVNPQFYRNPSDFKYGVTPIEQDGKWGYIDTTGRFIIEPQFEDARSFKDGVASVSKNGKWGLIDKSGKIFVINDNVCGHNVVKNGKGEITWPRNIKELCGQKN